MLETRKAQMKTTDLSIDNFLWPNRYMLFLHGFWPNAPDASIALQISVYLRTIISLTLVVSVLIPEILMIIVYWGDLNILTGVGCVATTVGQLFFKMLYVIARRRRFQKVYFTTRELWCLAINEEEKQSVNEPASQAKLFTMIFCTAAFANVISFTTSAIVIWIKYEIYANRTRNLPFDVWYGFDLQRSPNFEISFACQVIASVYCATGIAGLDTTLMSLILHVCGQFRLIKTRFHAIGRKINDVKDDKDLQADYLAEIKNEIGWCIEHHRRMVRIAKDIENLLSPVIFIQLLTSGLEICLSGFALMVCGNSSADLVKFTCYLFSMFVQLVIWCWPGEVLLQESQAVGFTVFHDVPWYKLPTNLQQDIVFIILRSQKKCQITALGFQVMCLQKLTDIFNTAGSYFALLRRVYDEEDDK